MSNEQATQQVLQHIMRKLDVLEKKMNDILVSQANISIDINYLHNELSQIQIQQEQAERNVSNLILPGSKNNSSEIY